MKKIIIIFIIMFVFSYVIFTEEENNSFFFSIMTQEQTSDFFQKYNYLLELDKKNIVFDDDQVSNFFDTYVGKESIESLLLESFFRQTKNKDIQKKVLAYIKKKKLTDEYSASLLRLYNSKENKIMQNNAEQIQYNYNGKYFDENINLFNQAESLVFDKELGLMLFDNPWINISYTDKDKKENNKDSFFIMYGGGTNSMTINFTRITNVTYDQFKESEIDNKYFTGKYANWKTIEIEKEGIFENSGADRISIAFGVSPEAIPEIDGANFNIYLYNESIQKGFVISYYMNFSGINNNYNLRNRIWNQLLLQLCFSFINVN